MKNKQDKWLTDAGKECFDKIGQSAYFMSMMTPGFIRDPLCALQLGYAILLNKPMYFAVERGVEVPEVVTRLALKIVHYEKTEDLADFKRAITEITDAIGQDIGKQEQLNP